MPRHVLVAGSASLFGRCLAALRLASSDDTVLLATAADPQEDPTLGVRAAVEQLADGKGAESRPPIGDRFRWLPVDLGLPEALPLDSLPSAIDEVWCICGRRSGSALSRRLLATLPTLGSPEFNFVAIAGAESTIERQTTVAEVEERCLALGVSYRIFLPSLLFGDELRPSDGEEILSFLLPLFDLQSEIEERQPEYFDYQALRCQLPADLHLNLLPVEQAVEMASELARGSATLGRTYRLEAATEVSFVDLCEQLEMVYDLGLLAVAEDSAMNAIDRLFQDRLGAFSHRLARAGETLAEESGPPVVTAEQNPAEQDPAEQDPARHLRWLTAIQRRQAEALSRRRDRASRLFATLEARTASRDGSDFTYYDTGQGEVPMVLLNALGQGLHYWCRLIESLRRRHRILIWEPRGGSSSTGLFGLADQVRDVATVLRAAGVEHCHLVGWCTGGKVAVEFYLAQPTKVSSIVFLNSAFKCLGSAKEFDTTYDHNFEPLCKVLHQRPEMATSVMSSLRSSAATDPDPAGSTDPEQLAVEVLSHINADLKQHVLAPFRDPATLVDYASQILDFWQYDSGEKADQVRIPSLFITSEYDQVASPQASRATAALFPQSRRIEIPGATHYCLYDRPEFVASLLRDFISPAVERAASES